MTRYKAMVTAWLAERARPTDSREVKAERTAMASTRAWLAGHYGQPVADQSCALAANVLRANEPPSAITLAILFAAMAEAGRETA